MESKLFLSCFLLLIPTLTLTQLELNCHYKEWKEPQEKTWTPGTTWVNQIGQPEFIWKYVQLKEDATRFNLKQDFLNPLQGNAISKMGAMYEHLLDIVNNSKDTFSTVTALCNNCSYYFRTYEGFCNNFLYPDYGMTKSRYSRLLPPNYSDGIHAPTRSVTGSLLPNARRLSLSLYGESTMADSFRTLMTMQWGQLVAHDLSQFTHQDAPADCCRNFNNKMCYPIRLHPLDPIALNSDQTCFNFSRSLSDKDSRHSSNNSIYAEKITFTTAFLDLGSIYGNSLSENKQVRLYKDGLLKVGHRKRFLPIIKSNKNFMCPAQNRYCYVMPDKRNQFIPTLIILHTLFVREHNRLANLLLRLNPHYSDERIFQEARKINIAQFQKITYYDWLPLMIGHKYGYKNGLLHRVKYPGNYVNDYNEYMNAAPYAEYAAAAFRYSHHQIPGWFTMIFSDPRRNQTMRLSDYFDREQNINLVESGNNFDSLLLGLITQLQKRSDDNIDRDIKHRFNRKGFEDFGSDLKALDIQRGRDFGVRSYNDFREYCGLARASTWSDFGKEISLKKISILRRLYNSVDDVDLSVGGSLETHAAEAIFGPTFQCIVGKQFLKTRKADRFFFEHDNSFGGFNQGQLAEIRKVTLAGLICKNGDNISYIQTNVYVSSSRRNKMVSCQTIIQQELNLNLWKDQPLFGK
ncbi:peroxidase [Glossina fuscipes]|uniref:Peroxidase n=1 Tax=Glossina fuscipes TaxID=7396 RepID=A0A9C5ZH58_9MUSC|nr:peroxidase [Glossina fuscipes]